MVAVRADGVARQDGRKRRAGDQDVAAPEERAGGQGGSILYVVGPALGTAGTSTSGILGAVSHARGGLGVVGHTGKGIAVKSGLVLGVGHASVVVSTGP